MTSQADLSRKNYYLLSGYEEAAAWLEHAATISDCSQEANKTTMLNDCSQALQCVRGLRRAESNRTRARALEQMARMLQHQVCLLEDSIDSSQPSTADLDSGSPSCDTNAKSRQAAIVDTIMQRSTLTFKDVAGLGDAKQLLREAIVLPLQYSHLFTGPRRPWRRILLYGPPGTGKTRLGQALSGEIGSNFYCVSSSDLLSSWVGESEKIIKELFQHAKRSSGTSIIFIDEVDCVCRQRSVREEEHTRRIKTELLRQMEGADTCQEDSQMFLLCATNCPWELDSAFIRRFQKRIYVPLPTRDVRLTLLKMFFSNIPTSLTEMEFNLLANKMEGYSGSDISIFCSDAAMMPVRELESSTHWKLSTGGHCYQVCSPTDPNGRRMKFSDIPPNQVCTRQITLEDCLKSLQHNHMTVTSEDLRLFEEFTQRCGQTG